MPKRAAVAAMAGLLLGGIAEAQAPPIRIASVTVADENARTFGRGCRRPFVPRANEGVFVLVVLENVTDQTQPFSLGMKIDGHGPGGGSTGTIDPMSRIVLPSGQARFDAGLHTVVAMVCGSSYPCGASEGDDVLGEVTLQFLVRE